MHDDLGQTLEVMFPAHLNDEPAVAGPEAVVDQRPGVTVLQTIDQKFGTMSVIAITASNIGHVDELCPPGAIASPEGRQDADRGEQRRSDVTQAADRGDRRRVVTHPFHLVDPRHRLDDGSKGGAIPVGGRGDVAETGD